MTPLPQFPLARFLFLSAFGDASAIQWHEFGEVAFAAARAADKPVLLDIGAVWCHWCHVMDRESYDDPEVAAIVNEHYIAVKVDRDERPYRQPLSDRSSSLTGQADGR